MIAKILFLVFLMKFASAMYMSPDYPRHHRPQGISFVPRPYGGYGYPRAHHPLYFMAIRNDNDNSNELDYEKMKETASKSNDKMVNSHFNLHESWNSKIEKVETNENGQSKQKVVKFIGQKDKTLEIAKNKHYYRNEKGRNEKMAMDLLQDNNRHGVSRHHRHHHYGNGNGNGRRYFGQQHDQVVYRTRQLSRSAGGVGDVDYKINEMFNKARKQLNRVNQLFKDVGKIRN